MNRLWLVTGSCLAALLLIGVGHLTLPEERKDGPSTLTLPSPSGRGDNLRGKGEGGGEVKVSPPPETPVLTRKERFAELLKLAENGPVTLDLPGGLRKTGGKEAVQPILSLMRSTNDWKTVGACVIALQDYRDPQLFHDILTRLDESGMLDSPGKLPWFSKALFSEYLKNAPDILPGLRAIRTRPSLVSSNLEVVDRALQSPEAETRRVTAEAVRKAVVGRHLDPKRGEELLAGQLERETEAVLKAQITGGLAEVRDFLKQVEQAQTEVK